MSDTSEGFAAVNYVRKMERKERFAEIMKDVDASADECRMLGYTLKLSNEGHHWLIQGHGTLFEWFPASGKFFRDRNYHGRYRPLDSWLTVRDELQAVRNAAETS